LDVRVQSLTSAGVTLGFPAQVVARGIENGAVLGDDGAGLTIGWIGLMTPPSAQLQPATSLGATAGAPVPRTACRKIAAIASHATGEYLVVSGFEDGAPLIRANRVVVERVSFNDAGFPATFDAGRSWTLGCRMRAGPSQTLVDLSRMRVDVRRTLALPCQMLADPAPTRGPA
jgi:hypothetical protein